MCSHTGVLTHGGAHTWGCSVPRNMGCFLLSPREEESLVSWTGIQREPQGLGGAGGHAQTPQEPSPNSVPALTLDPAAGPEMPAPSPGAVGEQIAVIKGACPMRPESPMHPPEGNADASPISQRGKLRPTRCSDHPESLLSSASRAQPTDPWVRLRQLTRPFSRGPSPAWPLQPGASPDAPAQECSEAPPASSSTKRLTNKAPAFTG